MNAVKLIQFKKYLKRTMRNIAKRYIEAGGDRDHVYLSLTIVNDSQDPSRIHIMCNNEHWSEMSDGVSGRDADFPVDMWEDVKLVDGKWEEIIDE